MSGSEAQTEIQGDRGDKGVTKLPPHAQAAFDAGTRGEFYCQIPSCGRQTRFLFWDRGRTWRTTCHDHHAPRPPLTATYSDVLRKFAASVREESNAAN